MKIFSGSSNQPLTKKITEQLGLRLSPVEEFIFPDGERRVRITERVVDEHCIIVQSTSAPVDQHYMELFFLIDGLRRSGAPQITAIVPYFGYQRQDHIFRDGEAVSLEVIINILSSLKIDRLISVDMHSSRIPDLFPDTIAVTHVSALSLFAEAIRRGTMHRVPTLDAVLVSPDMGGIRRIRQLSALLDDMSWAAIEKNRDLANGRLEVNRVGEGSIKDKKIGFIVDDMISSGGTMVKAAELLLQSEIEEVYAFATHAVFSEDAPALLQKSGIKKVFVTDSVYIPEEKTFPKLEVLSLADIVASAVRK